MSSKSVFHLLHSTILVHDTMTQDGKGRYFFLLVTQSNTQYRTPDHELCHPLPPSTYYTAHSLLLYPHHFPGTWAFIKGRACHVIVLVCVSSSLQSEKREKCTTNYTVEAGDGQTMYTKAMRMEQEELDCQKGKGPTERKDGSERIGRQKA